MILNYLLRLFTKQFVLFMNLLTGRTQKVRFFVAIKFILKTYIWLVAVPIRLVAVPIRLVAVPIRSHTSNVALVALGVLKLWAICNSAFCNWAFFALGVVLHWAFFCIGRFFALGVVFFDCFVFGCFVLGCFVPTSYFSLFLPEYFLFNFVYFFFGDSIRKLNIGFSSCTILTFWQEEASKIVDGFFLTWLHTWTMNMFSCVSFNLKGSRSQQKKSIGGFSASILIFHYRQETL